MTKFTRQTTIRLGRITMQLGKGQNGTALYEPCSILPPENAIKLQIPIALLDTVLARNSEQRPEQPLSLQPNKPDVNFTLPLARIVMPLDPIPRKTAADEATAPSRPANVDQPALEKLVEQICARVRSGKLSRGISQCRLERRHKRNRTIHREALRYPLLMLASGVMNVMAGREKPPATGEVRMPTFTINDDNNVTVFNSAHEAAQAGDSTATFFDSQAALQKISAAWPLSRLVEIWNSIPGQREVQTFPDRGKAVARIWKAIQVLGKNGSADEKEAEATEPAKKKERRKRRVTKRAPMGKKVAKDAERSNKKAAVIAMMKRAKGATLAEIMQATSWQAHTVRGFVSILGSKGGQKISSSKNAAGERTYRVAK